MPTDTNKEIEHYLNTGEHDQNFLAWPGEDFLARAKHGKAALVEALISAVRQRTPCVTMPEHLIDMDVAALTRAKLAPMVGGLFPQGERAAVLDALSRSTFEAYSRILTLGKGPAGRRMRLFELEQRPMPVDERVDAAEYVDVLREAVEARNGWKRILDRCSNQRPVRRREQQAERSL